ncbi:MAG: FAD-binding protein [Candidatus Aureabacteria bacterium]|nr:FAD-binding protein [Candidatus Auribacterota bacterium]
MNGLHIVVCIKQVPDTTQVRIDPIKHTLIREGVPSIINPYDVHAIEEGLRLKEKYQGRVTVISMGPPQTEEALRKALSLGADSVYLVCDHIFAGADTNSTSLTLSGAVKYLSKTDPVDLILCGKQSIDGDTAQVGPGIASRLKFNPLTYVDQILNMDLSAGTITVRRKLEGAYEKVTSPLPALVTVLKEINEPRYATLPGLIRSLRADIPVLTNHDLGLNPEQLGFKGSPSKVKHIFTPPLRSGGNKIAADNPSHGAEVIFNYMLEAGLLNTKEDHSRKKTKPSSPDKSDDVIFEGDNTVVIQPGGVWIFLEHHDNEIARVSQELLGIGKILARDSRSLLGAIVCGHQMDSLVPSAFGFGADHVFVVDDPVLSSYRTLPYTQAVTNLVVKYKPDILLMGATTQGRDLAGSVAAELSTGLTADCTGLKINTRGLLEQTRPAFGGNLMATILTEHHRPQMATVRPRVIPLPAYHPKKNGRIIFEKIDLKEKNIPVKIIEHMKISLSETNDISCADIIISGGRGMGSGQNFSMLKDLAAILDGVVGATRAAVDSRWLSYDHQIGQTGKTVRPTLYIACGISGAVQHRVGMQTSDHIIAVNTDPDAPVFSIASLGIIGSAIEIIPALNQLLQMRRAGK